MRAGTPQHPLGFDISKYSGRRGAYLWVPVGLTDTNSVYVAMQDVCLEFIQHRQLVSNLHITVAYSHRAVLPSSELAAHISGSQYNLPGYAYCPADVTYWRGNGEGYIVLNVRSTQLDQLHNAVSALGVCHDYPKYHPHVTLARGVGPPDLRLIAGIDSMNARLQRSIHANQCRKTGPLVVSDIDVWY